MNLNQLKYPAGTIGKKKLPDDQAHAEEDRVMKRVINVVVWMRHVASISSRYQKVPPNCERAGLLHQRRAQQPRASRCR